MISKEKKSAIIAEYGRKAWRYRFTGGSDRYLNSENHRAHRAFKDKPEGSPFQTWSVKGWLVRDVVCLTT